MKKIIKKYVKYICPPILIIGLNRLLKKSESNGLFDGDNILFKEILMSSKNYGEYGCGASTIWVSKNTNATIVSVDTSKIWVSKVLDEIGSTRANIQWIDCGEIGEWGTPVNYEKRQNFIKYANQIWNCAIDIDTVLIDGRFRVLCFLTAIKYANEGTRIIFDDYTNRPHYHIVEELVFKEKIDGRQALFIVPEKNVIDIKKLNELIYKFEYVIS